MDNLDEIRANIQVELNKLFDKDKNKYALLELFVDEIFTDRTVFITAGRMTPALFDELNKIMGTLGYECDSFSSTGDDSNALLFEYVYRGQKMDNIKEMIIKIFIDASYSNNLANLLDAVMEPLFSKIMAYDFKPFIEGDEYE